MFIQRINKPGEVEAERKLSDSMRHVEVPASKPLQIVDVNVVLLEVASWRKMEVP